MFGGELELVLCIWSIKLLLDKRDWDKSLADAMSFVNL